MNVFVTGGTGFVGGALVGKLVEAGHRVVRVGRSVTDGPEIPGLVHITADPTVPGEWQNHLKEAHVVINLAGAPISKYWSRRYKKIIYDSRILTTRNVVNGLPNKTDVTLISASATGYYGHRGEEILTEKAAPGNGFLAKVANDWEMEAVAAGEKGARVVLTRFGVVMGPDGGALDKLAAATRGFIGGPLGNGKQWFPWIHLDDLIEANMMIIENSEIAGPVNLVSPIPVRQKHLAKALGKILRRPSIVPAPGFMMRLVLGEFADSLLQSQKVIPDRLVRNGFVFGFLEIETALQNIFEQKGE